MIREVETQRTLIDLHRVYECDRCKVPAHPSCSGRGDCQCAPPQDWLVNKKLQALCSACYGIVTGAKEKAK